MVLFLGAALAAPAINCPTDCCVVIYKAGQHCNSVPIWDFSQWNHPGGPGVLSTSLCGRVLYNWQGKGAHGYQSANPENIDLKVLTGGGKNVGIFVDSECPSAVEGPESTPAPTSAPTTVTPTPAPSITSGSCTCFDPDPSTGEHNVRNTDNGCGFPNAEGCMVMASEGECKVLETEALGGLPPVAKFVAGGQCTNADTNLIVAVPVPAARHLRGGRLTP